MLARLVRNEQGATIVEFSIIFVLLMLLTWGVVEFGYMWWQWNSAEKATQMGVRRAVVSDPVASELKATATCGPAGTLPGTPCTGLTGFATAVCTGSAGGGSCTGGYTFNTTPFDTIVALMQGVFPLIQRQNVQVTYTYIGLGFVGRPEPAPAVTVQLTGMNFSFLALNEILGLGPIGLPSFEATLTAEDLNSAAPS